jgi:microcystin-dependent protein
VSTKNANARQPPDLLFAVGAGVGMYGDIVPPTAQMSPQMLKSVGGALHNNRQPFLSLRFCIALQGTFPTH